MSSIKTFLVSIPFFVIVLFCAIMPTQAQAAVGPNYIEQWGITWTFDKNISTDGSPGTYQYGQYANGDYWIAVDPSTQIVKIISMSPGSIVVDETASGGISDRIINGTMINPDPDVDDANQGYDSYLRVCPNKYNPHYVIALNRGRPGGNPLSAQNSLDVPAGSSLVSVISRSLPELLLAADPKANLKTAAVLTVIGQPLDGDRYYFRPPYSGKDKTSYFNKGQLDYRIFKNLPPVANTPSLATVERYIERPWIDHEIDFTNTYSNPSENMPWYGANMAEEIGEIVLRLNIAATDSEKETLLIRFVQLGIDLTGIYDDGGYWPSNGGINLGRKLSILVAGYTLNTPASQHMKDVGNWTCSAAKCTDYGTKEPSFPFQEDGQTFYVEETNPGVYNYGYGGYDSSHVGMPEWGQKHFNPALTDSVLKEAPYRRINAEALALVSLAVQIMGLREEWNHEAFFDYHDRWVGGTEGITKNEIPSVFGRNMWMQYRKDYYCFWKRYDQADFASNGSRDWSQCEYYCEAGTVLYGDVSGDGTITAYDAAMVIRKTANLISLDTNQTQRADVNRDGQVNITDAVLIAQRATGLISQFSLTQPQQNLSVVNPIASDLLASIATGINNLIEKARLLFGW